MEYNYKKGLPSERVARKGLLEEVAKLRPEGCDNSKCRAFEGNKYDMVGNLKDAQCLRVLGARWA